MAIVDGEGEVLATDHQLLTVREVAETMRVSTMTVYRLIRDGNMAAIRVGKHFRLRTEDVQAYLNAQRVNMRAGSVPADSLATSSGGNPWPAV